MASSTHHLVLLPGLDGTGCLFEALLSVLPVTFEASVVRYPQDQPVSQRELLACIRSVIPWGQPYVVVAESVAGALALKFVEGQPEDVRALVLCASFVSNPVARPGIWGAAFGSKPWFEQEPTGRLLRKHVLGEDAPEPLVERATDLMRSLKPEVRAARARAVLQADARWELRACQKPILYLQATEDKFVGSEVLEEIRSLQPSVKAVAVKGPHALLQRNPREAIEAIQTFLNELPAA